MLRIRLETSVIDRADRDDRSRGRCPGNEVKARQGGRSKGITDRICDSNLANQMGGLLGMRGRRKVSVV